MYILFYFIFYVIPIMYYIFINCISNVMFSICIFIY